MELNSKLNSGLAKQTIGQQPIQGLRHPEENGTTGWYIWCGNYSEKDDFYQATCTEHLIDYLPQIIPYLNLPPGWGFIIDENGYEDVWYDENYLKT